MQKKNSLSLAELEVIIFMVNHYVEMYGMFESRQQIKNCFYGNKAKF